MKMIASISRLPVKDIRQAVDFYQTRLGFKAGYVDEGFAVLTRDSIELHLWAACDNGWKFRNLFLFLKPIWSGTESFLAGTGSCRIEVSMIDDLFAEYKSQSVLYYPDTVVEETAWGTREFHAVDLHRNLFCFYEPINK